MLKSMIIAVVFSAFASSALAQAPAKNENDKNEIDSLFAIIDRLTEGASPAERLCYFTVNFAEYRRCRFPYIMKETWVNHSSGSLCRFEKYDDVVNGDGASIKGLGSGVLREVSNACDVVKRMQFEYKLINRIKKKFAPNTKIGS